MASGGTTATIATSGKTFSPCLLMSIWQIQTKSSLNHFETLCIKFLGRFRAGALTNFVGCSYIAKCVAWFDCSKTDLFFFDNVEPQAQH